MKRFFHQYRLHIMAYLDTDPIIGFLCMINAIIYLMVLVSLQTTSSRIIVISCIVLCAVLYYTTTSWHQNKAQRIYLLLGSTITVIGGIIAIAIEMGYLRLEGRVSMMSIVASLMLAYYIAYHSRCIISHDTSRKTVWMEQAKRRYIVAILLFIGVF